MCHKPDQVNQPNNMRGNAAFWVLAVLGLGVAMGFPLVNVDPNRLVPGEGVPLWQVWQTLAAPQAATDLAADWPLWAADGATGLTGQCRALAGALGGSVASD